MPGPESFFPGEGNEPSERKDREGEERQPEPTKDHDPEEIRREWGRAYHDYFDTRGASYFYGLKYLESKDPQWIEGFRQSAAAFQDAGARKERYRPSSQEGPIDVASYERRREELLTDIHAVKRELKFLGEKWKTAEEYVAWAKARLSTDVYSGPVRSVLLGFAKAAHDGGDRGLGERLLFYLAMELNDREAADFLNEMGRRKK